MPDQYFLVAVYDSWRWAYVGSASPKNLYPQNNLFCLGVGLIKKTPLWQQILCIPCSGNVENSLSKSMYLSQMVNELQCFTLHTGTWLRGEHSGNFCGISCNSVVLQATNWRKHHWPAKNDAMVIILKSTRDYQYTLELQGMLRKEYCLQQTQLQYAAVEK